MAEVVFAVTQTPLNFPPRRLLVDSALLDRTGLAEPPGDGAQSRTILSCGAPIRGVRIRILDDNGEACGDGQVGEIAVASKTLFEGYYRTDIAPEKLKAGWYRTG